MLEGLLIFSFSREQILHFSQFLDLRGRHFVCRPRRPNDKHFHVILKPFHFYDSMACILFLSTSLHKYEPNYQSNNHLTSRQLRCTLYARERRWVGALRYIYTFVPRRLVSSPHITTELVGPTLLRNCPPPRKPPSELPKKVQLRLNKWVRVSHEHERRYT